MIKDLLRSIKPIVIPTLYYSRFFELMRFVQRKRVTILMYHRFSEKPEPFKLLQKVFDRQLYYLSRKYSIISLEDYVQVLHGSGKGLPPNPLIITIDDGYRDNYEYAFPILKKYRVPATIFLTTDFITQKAWLWPNRLEYILKKSSKPQFFFPINGTDTKFRVDTFTGWHHTQLALFNYCRSLTNTAKDHVIDELANLLNVRVPDQVTEQFAPLTWRQIREMHQFGVGYGSHTCSHPIMSRLTDDELVHEVTLSKKVIEERIDSEVDAFCYPNGQPEDIPRGVEKILSDNGYRVAVTTTHGFNQQVKCDPFFLKRIAVTTQEQPLLSRELTRSDKQI